MNATPGAITIEIKPPQGVFQICCRRTRRQFVSKNNYSWFMRAFVHNVMFLLFGFRLD